ncbi:hypothetical protein M436DRAFT_58594 [Aureobasidium namibiae CBS 147.97]|uniref:Uncharacterized protein n=1 Tax=Aureobasidium namibiae CBS 147.97 TaxID=1043004 RepID=A0A074W631_9PEZI
MTIENIMIQTDQVVNDAVCCTVNLPISVLNTFLNQVHTQEDEEGAVPTLTLIHDLQTRFWGPTKELREPDNNDNDNKESNAGILDTPFLNLSPVAIVATLQHLTRTTDSAIQTDWFLVLDARSMEDHTAVIVSVEQEEVRQVRVEWKTASRYLAAASTSHPGIDELIEIAEGNEDGVLRD